MQEPREPNGQHIAPCTRIRAASGGQERCDGVQSSSEPAQVLVEPRARLLVAIRLGQEFSIPRQAACELAADVAFEESSSDRLGLDADAVDAAFLRRGCDRDLRCRSPARRVALPPHLAVHVRAMDRELMVSQSDLGSARPFKRSASSSSNGSLTAPRIPDRQCRRRLRGVVVRRTVFCQSLGSATSSSGAGGESRFVLRELPRRRIECPPPSAH